MKPDNAGATLSIRGKVQGVWYRAFARDEALLLGLNGWVRNQRDGSVYLEVEGDREKIDQLIQRLKVGSRLARVDEVEVDWKPFEDRLDSFEIRYD